MCVRRAWFEKGKWSGPLMLRGVTTWASLRRYGNPRAYDVRGFWGVKRKKATSLREWIDPYFFRRFFYRVGVCIIAWCLATLFFLRFLYQPSPAIAVLRALAVLTACVFLDVPPIPCRS